MEELRKKIEMKAYEYFQERGMSHGDDVGDWLRAEKDISKVKDNSKTRKVLKRVIL